VLVTEGYMDVVALAQLGFPNAVATLGTACTADHVQKLFRFTDSVVFSFDGDAAGRRAARKALDGALPFATDVRTVKFLFLPPEHDPDSYIRAFGHEAFARYVSEATPLSRFLVETASEGLDLATVEGRAHFASNARPSWNALPDGALKRQLLGELAALVQLESRELAQLWDGGPARGHPARSSGADETPRQGPARGGQTGTRFTRGSGSGTGAFAPRVRPASRADHAARLALTRMDLWEALSQEDHAMLSALPPPHGALFLWLDAQFHEHGALPWGALREELGGCDFEALAVRLMAGALAAAPASATPEDAGETRRELKDVITRMHLDRVEELQSQIADLASTDPAARERLRSLNARHSDLRKSLKTT
jgi:DNA primase